MFFVIVVIPAVAGLTARLDPVEVSLEFLVERPHPPWWDVFLLEVFVPAQDHPSVPDGIQEVRRYVFYAAAVSGPEGGVDSDDSDEVEEVGTGGESFPSGVSTTSASYCSMR